MLQVIDVCSSYGEAQVLNKISVTINPGEIVALLGRNGMGKTSLVRTIMGLGSPHLTQGEILMQGQSIISLNSNLISNLGIGYVPQGRRLFQSLTVLEHLTVLDNKKTNTWNVDRVLKAFPRLAERLHHRGNQLSGGERQMLAIGRALMTGPSIMLMDEPTEGLAPVTVELVESILSTLRDEGLGILLVEQNLYSALAVANRVYIIETGQIVWEGLPSILLSDQKILERYLGIH
ncbi:MAG: ABC transporter ATP-binding protein [Betaproteobacteria bacterium]|jgi:branched-chain amino acid transport system ATP-binding protein